MDRISKSDEDILKNRQNTRVSDFRFVKSYARKTSDEKRSENYKMLQKDMGNNVNDVIDCNHEDISQNEQQNFANAHAGLCAVCNLPIGGISGPGGNNIGFEQSLCCDRGHLLCHRCIQRLSIRTDAGCVLCRPYSRRSAESNISRDSDTILNDTPARTESTAYHAELERLSDTKINDYKYNSWSHDRTEEPVTRTRRNLYRNDVKRVESCSNSIAELVTINNVAATTDLQTSETRVNGQMVTECSRRPIRCPRLDCAVNVAFSALTHHFLFDHPDVPILSVEPGVKSTLIVNFGALPCDTSRCLALLLVSGKLSGAASRLFNGNQIHPKYRNRLPLPVLAARLSSTNRYSGPDHNHESSEDHRDADVVIAWVAGLDIGNATADSLRCSIQVIDSAENEFIRSLTYTGPVNSLRTAQRPRQVFLTGDCVIVHEGLVNNITADRTSLNINVIVH